MAARCRRMCWAKPPERAKKRRPAPPFLQSTRSHLSCATIDEQLDTGDVAGIVRRQKRYRLGDFVRGAETIQRHARLQGILHVVTGEYVEAGGLDRTRADQVDADFPGLQIRGQGSRKRTDGGFSGTVDGGGFEAF